MPATPFCCSILPTSDNLTSLCLTFEDFNHLPTQVEYAKHGSLAALAVSIRHLPALQVGPSWAAAES